MLYLHHRRHFLINPFDLDSITHIETQLISMSSAAFFKVLSYL
jgi:hypothetical protein